MGQARSAGFPAEWVEALRQALNDPDAAVRSEAVAVAKSRKPPGLDQDLVALSRQVGQPAGLRIDSNANRPTPTSACWSGSTASRRSGARLPRSRRGPVPVHPQRRSQRPGGQRRVDAVRRIFADGAPGLLNRLMGRSVRDWDNSRNDALTFQVALEHLRRDTPRVLYVGFGDTDEYAHGGRYDQYLRAAHDADAALKTLWDELQATRSTAARPR